MPPEIRRRFAQDLQREILASTITEGIHHSHYSPDYKRWIQAEEPSTSATYIVVRNALMAASVVAHVGKTPHARVLTDFYSEKAHLIVEPDSDFARYFANNSQDNESMLDKTIRSYILSKITNYYTRSLPWPLSLSILSSKHSDGSALSCLRKILRSDLDCGRADQLMRSNFTSGTEFGYIDVQRICKSTRILNEDNHRWSFCYSERAQSAIENLLERRHQYYRWVRHHPHTVAARSIINFALSDILELHSEPLSSLSAFDRHLLIHVNSEKTAAVTRNDLIDDHTVNEVLKAFIRSPRGSDLDQQERAVALCDAAIRRKRNWAPVWQSEAESVELWDTICDEIQDICNETRTTLNLRITRYEKSSNLRPNTRKLLIRRVEDFMRFLDDSDPARSFNTLGDYIFGHHERGARFTALRQYSKLITLIARSKLPPLYQSCHLILSYNTVTLWRETRPSILLERHGKRIKNDKDWTSLVNLEYSERQRPRLSCIIVSPDDTTRDRGHALHSLCVRESFAAALPFAFSAYMAKQIQMC